MLQDFLLDDNNDDKEENLQVDEGQKVNSEWLCESRKVNTEEIQQSTSIHGKGQKFGTAKYIPSTSTKFRSGHTV